MNKSVKTQAGAFTLVEIMIVVAVIGLLSVLGMPSLMKARERSLTLKCIENQRMIDAAVCRYEIDYGQTLHTIRNNGPSIRDTLLAADFISIKQAFECPTSQAPDHDDIHLRYTNQDFVGAYCTIAPAKHVQR